MDWRRDIFAEYASDRSTGGIPGYRVERLEDLTRHEPKSGDEALFSFARFASGTADRRIGEELERLRMRGWEAEWKVHDFDEPPDLKSRLEAQRLRAHHAEVLMVLDPSDPCVAVPMDGDVTVEVAAGAQLDELARLQEEVWRIRLPWLACALREMTDPVHGSGVAFYARIGGRIVASGWIDFPPGSRFAQLCGGAVLEPFRGRGVYSHLFARRVAEARARGVPWIAVDAAPMSRPILERKGFRCVCNTFPMRTRPFETTAVTQGFSNHERAQA